MTPEPFNGKERRAYIRLKRSLPVRFKIHGGQAGKTYSATTRNISRGGMCMEIDREPEELLEKISAPGCQIAIDIEALISKRMADDSAEPVWINSRVDWARKPTRKSWKLLMGLEFEDLAEENRKRIHEFVVEEMVRRYEKPD